MVFNTLKPTPQKCRNSARTVRVTAMAVNGVTAMTGAIEVQHALTAMVLLQ